MTEPDKDRFLSRWSKRKLEGAPEEEVIDVEPPDPEADFEGKTDEEILEALKLPDPETLKAGDDFKAFMNSAVPTRLRNRALRKLWVSNPVLANLDELLDYGEDFTDAATVVENLQTAYQVGRGFMTPDDDSAKEEDAEAVVSEEKGPDDGATLETTEPDEPVEMEEPQQVVEDISPEPESEDPQRALITAEEAVLDAEVISPRPRRMRFHFDGS